MVIAQFSTGRDIPVHSRRIFIVFITPLLGVGFSTGKDIPRRIFIVLVTLSLGVEIVSPNLEVPCFSENAYGKVI